MEMLTNKYRPVKFSDVVGQVRAVRILKGVIKSGMFPKSIILYGPYGTGKTTLARVFGRALFCNSYTNDVCGVCDVCSDVLNLKGLYYEFDSSIVGNVESVRELFDFFEMFTGGKRLFVFDEIHLASLKSQSMFLKMLEDFSKSDYFIFCTTNLDGVYKPLVSRSLLIELDLIDDSVMRDFLLSVVLNEGLSVSEEVISKIVLRAGGHVRDALNFLQLYCVSGDESSFSLPIDEMLLYFKYIFSGDRVSADLVVKKVLSYPLVVIRKVFNSVILSLVRAFVLGDGKGLVKEVSDMLKGDVFKLFKLSSEVWVQNAFSDEYLTASLFYSLMELVGGGKNGS